MHIKSWIKESWNRLYRLYMKYAINAKRGLVEYFYLLRKLYFAVFNHNIFIFLFLFLIFITCVYLLNIIYKRQQERTSKSITGSLFPMMWMISWFDKRKNKLQVRKFYNSQLLNHNCHDETVKI